MIIWCYIFTILYCVIVYQVLRDYFDRKHHPDKDEIALLSGELGMPDRVIKVHKQIVEFIIQA